MAGPGTKLSRHGAHLASCATKFAQRSPYYGVFAKKLARQAIKRHFWGIFRALGELFRAHTHAKPSRANFFAHKTQHNGDAETDNTSSTEKRAKNTRFSPAKATPVSTSHGHKLAKATGVSKNRTAWSTGPGRGAGGRQGQHSAKIARNSIE